jgi:hypothetical protein
MFKRILTILIIALLPTFARAEGLYAGGQGMLPAFGVHLGWDAQDYGIRGSLNLLPIGSIGYLASIDAYWLTNPNPVRFYLGAGGTLMYEGNGKTIYTALEGLAGFRVDIGNGAWGYLEYNPGFIVSRNPPLSADVFEYIPVAEILLAFRLNLGFSFKF